MCVYRVGGRGGRIYFVFFSSQYQVCWVVHLFIIMLAFYEIVMVMAWGILESLPTPLAVVVLLFNDI